MRTKILIPVGQTNQFLWVLNKNSIQYRKEAETPKMNAFHISWHPINGIYYFRALNEVWRSITGKYFEYFDSIDWPEKFQGV